MHFSEGDSSLEVRFELCCCFKFMLQDHRNQKLTELFILSWKIIVYGTQGE